MDKGKTKLEFSALIFSIVISLITAGGVVYAGGKLANEIVLNTERLDCIGPKVEQFRENDAQSSVDRIWIKESLKRIEYKLDNHIKEEK